MCQPKQWVTKLKLRNKQRTNSNPGRLNEKPVLNFDEKVKLTNCIQDKSQRGVAHCITFFLKNESLEIQKQKVVNIGGWRQTVKAAKLVKAMELIRCEFRQPLNKQYFRWLLDQSNIRYVVYLPWYIFRNIKGSKKLIGDVILQYFSDFLLNWWMSWP